MNATVPRRYPQDALLGKTSWVAGGKIGNASTRHPHPLGDSLKSGFPPRGRRDLFSPKPLITLHNPRLCIPSYLSSLLLEERKREKERTEGNHLCVATIATRVFFHGKDFEKEMISRLTRRLSEHSSVLEVCRNDLLEKFSRVFTSEMFLVRSLVTGYNGRQLYQRDYFFRVSTRKLNLRARVRALTSWTAVEFEKHEVYRSDSRADV